MKQINFQKFCQNHWTLVYKEEVEAEKSRSSKLMHNADKCGQGEPLI
jgi:hypothetical protein